MENSSNQDPCKPVGQGAETSRGWAAHRRLARSTRYISVVLTACLILLVSACRPLTTPAPGPGSTVAAPLGMSTQAPVAAPSATAQPAATLASAGALLSSALDVAWDDRSIFRRGLVDSEQEALQQLPGAPVYHITLEISDSLTSAEGHQAVRFTNTEDAILEEVVFRLFPNLTGGSSTVSSVTVDGQPVEPVLDQQGSVLRVPLPAPLQPGEQAVIDMDFAVSVPTDPAASSYAVLGYLDGVLTLAHFYPMVAVYDDEGWNTEIASPQGDIVYADSSFYLARVTAPEELKIAAPGVTLDEQRAHGKQVLTIAAGPARDFYLAASPDYVVTSKTVGQTRVNSYSRPESVPGAQQALDAAIDALHRFEQRLGPYPYTEFDIVETGTSALGVEYPGVVALAGRIYAGEQVNLLDPVTVHEVAHQWFYNVVGNDQVDEPWLDESLVQYLSMLYFQDRYGQAGYDGFRESLTGRWSRVDSADIPVGLPVSAYQDREYGAIVYGRGALFFEALAQKMGQPAFDAFLRNYFQSQRWGIATTESLKRLAEQQCACDLTRLFQEWVY